MALRRADGFQRYALAVQYHGASFLGFPFQGEQEDCILKDGTDLRGYRSVEGRLREALTSFTLSNDAYENIQVSSRTDRGVHALYNTFHVDLHCTLNNKSNNKFATILYNGLNYFLSKQGTSWDVEQRQRHKQDPTLPKRPISSFTFLGNTWSRYSPMQELRILGVSKAPEYMVNKFHSFNDPTQPAMVDWNARFSATQRTYIYRIINVPAQDFWGTPFDWDRSWRVYSPTGLDISAMQQAATILTGEHDFSSFRGAHCQRASPIVHLRQIQVNAQPYQLLDLVDRHSLDPTNASSSMLISIKIVGDAFVYRQVRNMVGCLVEVGKGKVTPAQVLDILRAKDRKIAPAMAPAQGLFLADVQHGDFQIV